MEKALLLIALCTALMLAGGSNAAAQINFVSKYSSCENADTVLIKRNAFYSLISVTGYDKKTKQLMKNLNVGKVVYLNMIDSPEADCRALDSEIREAVANGQYIPLDSTSLEQGRVSMLFYVDNEHIKQMLMYTPPPKTSLIQIGCYANYHMLSTEKFKGGKEAAKQD